MLEVARANGIIPAEQYSEQQSTAEDGSRDKNFQADISGQFRLPMWIMSVDAADCYNRINHAIVALMYLALGVPVFSQDHCCDAAHYSDDEVLLVDWVGRIGSLHWWQFVFHHDGSVSGKRRRSHRLVKLILTV